MPGKANIGRSSFPCNANQCHVAGLTSPLGSQNDVAGTRQRRSSNEPRQNRLSMILSSRTLVTRRGARSFWCSTKPQLIKTISRSPSALCRTTGATWPGKIAGKGSKAAPRLCETRKKRATASRFLFSEYRLHTGANPDRQANWLPTAPGARLLRYPSALRAGGASRRPQLEARRHREDRPGR
jgi:hypothetical protein